MRELFMSSGVTPDPTLLFSSFRAPLQIHPGFFSRHTADVTIPLSGVLLCARLHSQLARSSPSLGASEVSAQPSVLLLCKRTPESSQSHWLDGGRERREEGSLHQRSLPIPSCGREDCVCGTVAPHRGEKCQPLLQGLWQQDGRLGPN